MPSYGPFETRTVGPEWSWWKHQFLYKSLPKGSIPLPYIIWRGTTQLPAGSWNHNKVSNIASVASVHADALYPKAYDNFYSKAYKRAELGMTAATYNQSFNMVEKRARQLTSALKYLSKRKYHLLASTLGIDRPAARNAVKRAGGVRSELSRIWLEFTFGWAPLVSDMYKAVAVLKEPPHSFRIRSRASDLEYFTQPWDGGSAHAFTCNNCSYMGGDIVITSPNKLLANQLGLTNLGAIAWDLVPWSFVIDMVLPVGKFLTSFNNDVGIEIHNGYRGWSVKLTGGSSHIAHGSVWCKSVAVYSHRVVGPFPVPRLLSRLRLPKLEHGPWLATTALALLQTQSDKLFRK